MDEVVDFSNAIKTMRAFGGSDQKIAVRLDNKVYMLKFSQYHAKRTDIPTCYVNNVLSEYICSHIVETIGLPVHRTVLGLYGKEDDSSDQKVIVVGCEDFRKEGDTNADFSEFLRAEFRPDEIKRVVRLDQIYTVLNDAGYFSDQLRETSIERYWDTFIVDALVGNYDRHPDNWGYLYNNNEVRLAPIYDFGSCLLPQISDDVIKDMIADDFEMLKRCLVYPTLALYITKEKNGKVGYYDMLSSNYDRNCTLALLRIAPRIDMAKIDRVIDETPLITDIRRMFYKKYLRLRKSMIIEKAYCLCAEGKSDEEAMKRIVEGVPFSDNLLLQKMANGEITAKYE